MDSHKDIYLDINKFDEDKLIYIKPIMFYKVTKNIGIYYKKDIKNNKATLPHKRQKIIVQTPKMIVPFGVKEFDNNGRKSYSMSLSFSTLTNLYNEEEIKKFYAFVKKVDTLNEETIMDYKIAWGLPKNLIYRKSLKRLSKDFPHYMNVNLPHDEKLGFLFNTYNESAEKSKIDIIEKRSIVSVVMELTDLRFNDNDFRANWTVLQIRKFKPYSPIQEFFMSGCFICDEDNPEDTAYLQMIEAYRKKLATPLPIPMIPQINPNYAPMQFPPIYSQMNSPQIPAHMLPPIAHHMPAQMMHHLTQPASNSANSPPPPPPPPPSLIPPIPRIIVSADELQNAKKNLKPLKPTEDNATKTTRSPHKTEPAKTNTPSKSTKTPTKTPTKQENVPVSPRKTIKSPTPHKSKKQ